MTARAQQVTKNRLLVVTCTVAQCIQAIEILFAHVTLETLHRFMADTLSGVSVTCSAYSTVLIAVTARTSDT